MNRQDTIKLIIANQTLHKFEDGYSIATHNNQIFLMDTDTTIISIEKIGFSGTIDQDLEAMKRRHNEL